MWEGHGCLYPGSLWGELLCERNKAGCILGVYDANCHVRGTWLLVSWESTRWTVMWETHGCLYPESLWGALSCERSKAGCMLGVYEANCHVRGARLVVSWESTRQTVIWEGHGCLYPQSLRGELPCERKKAGCILGVYEMNCHVRGTRMFVSSESMRRTVMWEAHGCLYPGSLRDELSCERHMAVCILRVYEGNCHVRGARLVVCWESMRQTVMWEKQGWLYPGSLWGKVSCERDTAVLYPQSLWGELPCERNKAGCILGVYEMNCHVRGTRMFVSWESMRWTAMWEEQGWLYPGSLWCKLACERHMAACILGVYEMNCHVRGRTVVCMLRVYEANCHVRGSKAGCMLGSLWGKLSCERSKAGFILGVYEANCHVRGTRLFISWESMRWTVMWEGHGCLYPGSLWGEVLCERNKAGCILGSLWCKLSFERDRDVCILGVYEMICHVRGTRRVVSWESTSWTVMWEGCGCLYPGSLRAELSCERDTDVCILEVYEANCYVRGTRLVVSWESMMQTVMWEGHGCLYPGSLWDELSCERSKAGCILGVYQLNCYVRGTWLFVSWKSTRRTVMWEGLGCLYPGSLQSKLSCERDTAVCMLGVYEANCHVRGVRLVVSWESARWTVMWEGHGGLYPGSLWGELSCERDTAVCILGVYEANCHVRGTWLVVSWESARWTVMWEGHGGLYPGSLRGELSCERDMAVCILGVCEANCHVRGTRLLVWQNIKCWLIRKIVISIESLCSALFFSTILLCLFFPRGWE